MPRYMLDTDTCSYIMKRSSEPLLRKLQSVPVTDVCMSVITKAELRYGVEVSMPGRCSGSSASTCCSYILPSNSITDPGGRMSWWSFRGTTWR